jgi:hypothetical protein
MSATWADTEATRRDGGVAQSAENGLHGCPVAWLMGIYAEIDIGGRAQPG